MENFKSTLIALFCISTLNTFVYAADGQRTLSPGTLGFHLEALYLQPSSNNLKYAVFVSGHQPYYQSWHNQSVNPGHSPAFELGLDYGFSQSPYDITIDWMHFNSSDSNTKQASQNVDISTVEFVAPPYDVGPAVFSIKRATSTADFNFNGTAINIGKTFQYNPQVRFRIFGGVNILNLNQTLSTTFSDNAGSPEIPDQAYALPPDPHFWFQTKNVSKYLGIGPDVGINAQYESPCGLGVVGGFMGTLSAGTISAKDDFTSASARLLALGIVTSHQAITTPNTTQVVPGLDSKLGLFYNHTWKNAVSLTIEAGYRFAYYINAISEVSPDTLVQAGLDSTIPEFATGTMAINSTTSSNNPFSMQGPYLNITLTL